MLNFNCILLTIDNIFVPLFATPAEKKEHLR